MRNVADLHEQALQDTRFCLKSSDYPQVPQLSVGQQIELEQPLIL